MQIKVRKGQLPILIFNLCFLAGFFTHFFTRKNYEFVLYVGVIIFFLAVFIAANSKVYFPNALLWSLTIWALMHMCGGAVYIRQTRLYDIILIPLSNTYPILRYDQLVHIIGFGAATITLFYVLKPLLRPDIKTWTALSIIIISAGLGIGALNEIVECLAAAFVPETGVGGYLNTSLDLIADIIGAIIAMVIIRLTSRLTANSQMTSA